MRISDWSSDVCSSDLQQTPLWPRAAPNMEDVKLPPEYSETATNPKRFAGRPVTGVFNVTVPTLTVFPAKQPGNGAAMLVRRYGDRSQQSPRPPSPDRKSTRLNSSP